MKKLLVIMLVLFPVKVFSAPSISGVTGTVTHKASIVIAGSDFGTKSPAAPFIWDACDSTSTSTLETFWPTDTYPRTCSTTPSETPYLMDYRSTFHGFSTMPNNKITKFLSAAAITCLGCPSPGDSCTNDWDSVWASALVTSGAFNYNTMFATWWYRVSSTMSLEDNDEGCPESCVGDNFKEISANGCSGTLCGTYLNDLDNYATFCNSDTPPITTPSDAGLYGAASGGASSCASANKVQVNNPMGQWIHLEALWDDTNGFKWGYSDGDNAGYATYWGNSGDLHYIDHASNEAPQTISIGGFLRWPRASTTGNYRYWAAIYIDNTFSRVMMGNASTWANSTIREPQIPTVWAATGDSITVTVNTGSITGTGYLYVFDSSNTSNSTGYEVTLDEVCTDGDSDDYGDPASGACLYPQLDCDDTDADVNPGQIEEYGGGLCSDGKDNDCDSFTDGADPGCIAQAATTAHPVVIIVH